MSELETRDWKTVKIERKGDGITFLYMNRPEKRNAMNPTMCFEMCDILDLLIDDKETRVIVLTGAGLNLVQTAVLVANRVQLLAALSLTTSVTLAAALPAGQR